MIGRTQEYEKMYQLEEHLWWYRSLHERVAESLQRQFGSRRDVQILDVGCGTGGMLHFLRRLGYTNLRGLDGSEDAVTYCQKRDLPVTLMDLRNMTPLDSGRQYDVIVCNDVFCYFLDPELTTLLSALSQKLKPGGILISNNNAFAVFRGQHDVAVGILQRFTRADFKRLLPKVGLQIAYSTYWSFIVSLPILLVRQWQRWQLTMKRHTLETAQSDVYLPSSWLNKFLYLLVQTERKLLRRTPFGSSLFMVIIGQ